MDLLENPQSTTFETIMAAQPDDSERLAAAIKLAETSTDPSTKASAIYYVQLHFIRVADPSVDVSNLNTIERAQEHIDHQMTDPASCENLRKYFRGL